MLPPVVYVAPPTRIIVSGEKFTMEVLVVESKHIFLEDTGGAFILYSVNTVSIDINQLKKNVYLSTSLFA